MFSLLCVYIHNWHKLSEQIFQQQLEQDAKLQYVRIVTETPCQRSSDLHFVIIYCAYNHILLYNQGLIHCL